MQNATKKYWAVSPRASTKIHWLARAFLALLLFGLIPRSEGNEFETLGERISRLDQELMELHPELFRIPFPPNGFKSVFLSESPEVRLISIFMEFPGRLEGAGHATLDQWRDLFHNENAAVPPSFNGFGSYTDFAGLEDPKVYRFGVMDVARDAENEPISVVLARDENFNPLIPIILKNGPRIISKKGDTVPRASTPEFTGTTFLDFGSPQFASPYVVFAGYGQNFSGIYRAPIEGGEVSVLTENFGAAGNELGDITQVCPSMGDLYFTTSKGIFKIKNEPGAAPVLLVASGNEYAPGKTWELPRSIDMDGNQLVFDGFDQNFDSSVFYIQNARAASQDIAVTYIAGAETAIPGGTGNFTGAQRPIISGDLIVFEAFGSAGALGVFGVKNDTIVPIVKRGDTLEGKTVSIGIYDRGSALGNQVGLAVQFQDLTSAPYIYTIGASPPVVQFTPGSARYSPTEGFSANFVGEVGKSYKLQYFSIQNTQGWQESVTVTFSGPEQTVTDVGAIGEEGRLYRLESIP